MPVPGLATSPALELTNTIWPPASRSAGSTLCVNVSGARTFVVHSRSKSATRGRPEGACEVDAAAVHEDVETARPAQERASRRRGLSFRVQVDLEDDRLLAKLPGDALETRSPSSGESDARSGGGESLDDRGADAAAGTRHERPLSVQPRIAHERPLEELVLLQGRRGFADGREGKPRALGDGEQVVVAVCQAQHPEQAVSGFVPSGTLW